jgi:H+/Cl- antiporter ClcA
MGIRVSQFLTIVLTAVALIPPGAHLMALPVKIDMPEEPYFVVQQIYRGWAWMGITIVAALFANFANAMLTRRHPAQFRLSLAASLLIAATLIIFFVWTYPANQATGNWTSVPDQWEQLRTQWEYSHAANAAITFLALLCAVGAGLSRETREREAQSGAPETSHHTTRHA